MQNNEPAKPLPIIFVDKETLNIKVKNYLKNKFPLLKEAQKSKGGAREETKSIWYSKEHVETWLSEMNHLKADGMRIHFAAYGEEENMVAGQLCLVVSLTRSSENNSVHEDITYENEADFSKRKNAGSNTRSITEPKDKEEEKPKQFNYGAPCPPIC
jgi:hypothetical protein